MASDFVGCEADPPVPGAARREALGGTFGTRRVILEEESRAQKCPPRRRRRDDPGAIAVRRRIKRIIGVAVGPKGHLPHLSHDGARGRFEIDDAGLQSGAA